MVRSAWRLPRVLAVLLLAAVALAGCGSQRGQDSYPSKEIRLLVPYTAGGPTDIAARSLGRYLGQELGQQVVVENMPGASGSLAYQELLSAKPDGHTLAMCALPTAVLNYLTNDVGYTRDSFRPVAVATQVPSALVVPADSPYRDLQSLFADARANPSKVKVGTPGATNTHAAETRRISKLYGVPLEVVPFNGNSEVQAALLGGNVTVGFVNASQDMLPAIESGRLRPLVVGTPQRLDYLDAPTFVELGYPELVHSTTTFGVLAPEETPDEVVRELEDVLRRASADPAVLDDLDRRYVPERFLGSADLERMFAQTEDTFRGVVGN
jgi:tripartite-type tricarboxylate transporter receptor subunit TctC